MSPLREGIIPYEAAKLLQALKKACNRQGPPIASNAKELGRPILQTSEPWPCVLPGCNVMASLARRFFFIHNLFVYISDDRLSN